MQNGRWGINMANHPNRSKRTFTLRVSEQDLPGILIGLSRYRAAEQVENETGRSLGKRGLAGELERLRSDLIAQRDAQVARRAAVTDGAA